jgi:hypothetical protein
MTGVGQSGGRDMEPLSERPGYNASPNDWVRYANHLEVERDCLRCALDAILAEAREADDGWTITTCEEAIQSA